MAAFRVGKATYFALAYDVIRVCLFENSTCTFSQEVLQFARILRAVEYYGKWCSLKSWVRACQIRSRTVVINL